MSPDQANHGGEAGAIELTGRLDSHSVPGLLTSVNGWLQQAGATLRLNLGAVERADSAGVAFLLEIQRQAKAGGKSVAFIDAPEQMQAIIDFCSLREVLALE